MFKQNIDNTGRIIRFLIGVILLMLSYHYSSLILLAIALFCFFEVFMGWCAFYHLIGKDSCSLKK